MKMIKIYTSLLFFMMHGMIHAHGPSQVMPAYHNKIVAADVVVGQDDASLVITLQCQKTPICFYYPESYQDSMQHDKQRFFLPRTDWNHKSMKEFTLKLDAICQRMNIECQCRLLTGSYFGLEMIFNIDSFEYDIKKIVDESDNNLVLFQINLKK